jgi:hypothetical protein
MADTVRVLRAVVAREMVEPDRGNRVWNASAAGAGYGVFGQAPRNGIA